MESRKPFTLHQTGATPFFAWSLSNLVALLRMNLFTHRDLWAWLDHPYQAPPPLALPQQEVLPFA